MTIQACEIEVALNQNLQAEKRTSNLREACLDKIHSFATKLQTSCFDKVSPRSYLFLACLVRLQNVQNTKLSVKIKSCIISVIVSNYRRRSKVRPLGTYTCAGAPFCPIRKVHRGVQRVSHCHRSDN